METAGNYARILFIDFNSAFNTIQRHVMIDKLQKLEVSAALVHWVFNFLSNRLQCVRVGDIKSPVLVSNTGAPQGCVLSQFVYTLYTNDCRSVDSSTQFVRFSDDTAMLALLNDFASYQSYLSSVVRFSSWCSKKILHRNRLMKISHVYAKIIGLPTPKLSEIIDHAILKKARAVATESDHPLSTFFHVLPSQKEIPLYKM